MSNPQIVVLLITEYLPNMVKAAKIRKISHSFTLSFVCKILRECKELF